MTSLDHPIWEALTGLQKELAVGTARARAYHAEIGPLAAVSEASPEALADLAVLVRERGRLLLFNAAAPPVPRGCRTGWAADLLQMVATQPMPPADLDRVMALGEADAPEMLALAKLTVPGPFSTETHRLGQFYGVRIDGRLAAMAGQRLRLPGHTEISAICTHPDYRGRGLARLVCAACADRIAARGDRPFLHVLATNETAVRLYEALGFTRRRSFIVSRLFPDS